MMTYDVKAPGSMFLRNPKFEDLFSNASTWSTICVLYQIHKFVKSFDCAPNSEVYKEICCAPNSVLSCRFSRRPTVYSVGMVLFLIFKNKKRFREFALSVV